MKDLFSGSLGRIDNHGGSRMFTTPNTVYVPPEYEVETDVPSVAEFVTCSLDGRLWIWKRSRRYYVAVFRWNEETEKLVFVSTSIFSNINIIGRGIDWLLTDTMIIQVSDDEPYVFTANLFDNDGESFLYSILRSKNLSSGIDPITKAAWGLSEDNGNSEGYGYFKRSALLQSVNKYYSLLPAIDDWHIIKNFLVRKADNPLAEAHNSMLNIRPLIPLEFNGSTPIYGCGFDNDIFITQYNSELWARGLYHIGRCYILPAVFAEDGTPQEFYLYISPDYPCSPYKSNFSAATKPEWLNMGICHMGETLYGFLTEKMNSLDKGLCYQSDTPKVFIPASKEWLQLSENGSMFIDNFNNSGLILNNNGGIFLNNDNASYECKGLQQWLAPADKIDAITKQAVISSWDNATLAIYIQQGFGRELLIGKTLPISAKVYSSKRLSVGNANIDNKKAIQVNNIKDYNEGDSIAWENIYKPAVAIKSINFKTLISNDCHCLSFQGHPVPVFIIDESHYGMYRVYIEKVAYREGDEHYLSTQFITINNINRSTFIEMSGYGGGGTNSWGEDVYPAHNVNYQAIGFYIIPETGGIEYFNINFSTQSYVPIFYGPLEGLSRDNWWDETTVFYSIYYAGIDDHGNIGVGYAKHIGGLDGSSINMFHPVEQIPTSTLNYQYISKKNLSLQHFQYPQYVPQYSACSASAVFQELHSNTIFPYEIPSIYYTQNGENSGYQPDHESYKDTRYIYNFWDINSYRDYGDSYTRGLHAKFLWKNANHSIMVFKSELHTDIFDFYSETERSRLS